MESVFAASGSPTGDLLTGSQVQRIVELQKDTARQDYRVRTPLNKSGLAHDEDPAGADSEANPSDSTNDGGGGKRRRLN